MFYINTHFYNATLNVHTYRDTVINDSVVKMPLRYVIVQLFQTKEDLEANRDQVVAGQTDANGDVSFFHLTSDYYYLRGWHYLYGVQMGQAATPDKSVIDTELDY